MYADNDPRSRLEAARSASAGPTRTAARDDAHAPLRRPVSYQMDVDKEDAVAPGGSRSWIVRGEQFCVAYSRVVAGEELAITKAADEYIVISTDPGADLRIAAQSEQIAVRGRSVVIVPGGTSAVTSLSGGDLIRVFGASTPEVAALARNRQDYAGEEERPTPPESTRAGRRTPNTGGVRAHALDGIEPADGRFGRIFRSTSLMVNVMYPQWGPRDPEAMSPHSHAEFDQCTITVLGDHVHHLRTPWTPIKAHWMPDQHLLCHSPSITVIPRGIVHTTEQVGDHEHLMIDVFAPPRADFLAMSGWVLNAPEYQTSGDGADGR